MVIGYGCGMNYNQIIQYIKEGKKVHWSNASYWVIIDSCGQCFISYLNRNYVRLTEEIFNKDYNPKDFYVYPF